MTEKRDNPEWAEELNIAVKNIAHTQSFNETPPPFPGQPVDSLVFEIEEEKTSTPASYTIPFANFTSHLKRPAKWALIGFSVGITFWYISGFWTSLNDSLKVKTAAPSAVELALRDKAVASLTTDNEPAGNSAQMDEESLPKIPKAEEETCVALELDREDMRIVERPCEKKEIADGIVPQNGWTTTSTPSTPSN